MNGYTRPHSHETPNSRNRPYGLPIRSVLATTVAAIAVTAHATEVPFSTANTIDGAFGVYAGDVDGGFGLKDVVREAMMKG